MLKPIVLKNYRLYLAETGTQKVLEVLFKYPDKEFSLSDLAKEAGVAKANIGTILDNLSAHELIEIKKLTKIWRIKAKQQSWIFIRSKIIYNLNFVYHSGLVEFLYEHFHHPKSMILFGSFRRGEDISDSDIDIAVETDKVGEYKVVGLRELVDFEKSIRRKIQVHLFNRKKIDINIFNNIANGVVLIGFLEVGL